MSKLIYENNIRFLKSYEYYYGWDFESYYNSNYDDTIITDNDYECVHQNEKLILCNISSIEKIIKYEKNSYKKNFFEWKKIPMFLYYDAEIFKNILYYLDLSKLETSKRIVFIIGMDNLEKYFNNMQTILPTRFIGKSKEIIENKIHELESKRSVSLNNARNSIRDYYSQNSKAIIDNILNKRYKVLFITSRFLGYRCLRDLYEGSLAAGYNAVLAIEDNNISRVYYELYVNEHKPDIIFTLNTFRFEMDFIPKQVIFTTWIIDRYKNIFNKETPLKLTSRDIVCNAIINDDRLWNEYGYKREKLIELVYPGNNYIYKKYNITQKEHAYYDSDIVLVSNNTDFNKYLNNTLNKFDKRFNECIYQMSKAYYELEYNEESIYGHELIKQYIKEWLIKYNLDTTDIEFDDIFVQFLLIRYFARKHVLARWLLEPNKYDIKLWGLDWNEMPEFSKYSMGPAPSGEVLSKIYQCSKIAIATQPDITYPSRVAEITLSGSLALIGYIPEEHDIIPCSRFMNIGEDIACYYNKKDLYKKLNYYLANQNERINMIKRTKQIIEDKLVVKQQALDTFESIEEQIRS